VNVLAFFDLDRESPCLDAGVGTKRMGFIFAISVKELVPKRHYTEEFRTEPVRLGQLCPLVSTKLPAD
jgi:hypothetical protein